MIILQLQFASDGVTVTNDVAVALLLMNYFCTGILHFGNDLCIPSHSHAYLLTEKTFDD